MPAVAPAQADAMALRDLWRTLLQLPIGTIRSRLSRGRRRLMQPLGQDALPD